MPDRETGVDQALDEHLSQPIEAAPSPDWLYHWYVSLNKPWDPPVAPEYIQKALRERQITE